MDLSKIKAVIADDDIFKGIDIRKALEFNGVRNITTVRSQKEFLKFSKNMQPPRLPQSFYRYKQEKLLLRKVRKV